MDCRAHAWSREEVQRPRDEAHRLVRVTIDESKQRPRGQRAEVVGRIALEELTSPSRAPGGEPKRHEEGLDTEQPEAFPGTRGGQRTFEHLLDAARLCQRFTLREPCKHHRLLQVGPEIRRHRVALDAFEGRAGLRPLPSLEESVGPRDVPERAEVAAFVCRLPSAVVDLGEHRL
ncbi:hypothetical protein ACFPRL_24065 [Pseudoclavibacter helvolus]